ncbi:MAG: hypothetical protein ACJAYX_000813 [Planctomycetota bacterium]|jgi:hypothetical protein
MELSDFASSIDLPESWLELSLTTVTDTSLRGPTKASTAAKTRPSKRVVEV